MPLPEAEATLEKMVAAAYDDAKQAAVNPFLYADDDGPLSLQHKIGKAIEFRKKLTLDSMARNGAALAAER